ncbi:hypothetical protein TNCV_1165371 [Trichonephila clavipes]|nr:hypothetical protein TNCV_1165371 [Trichonephila clavipes]
MARRAHPDDPQTWKNNWKAGGGAAYCQQCSCKVRNQQKCRFASAKRSKPQVQVLEKDWWWPFEDDNLQGSKPLYHPAGEKSSTTISKRHCYSYSVQQTR